MKLYTLVQLPEKGFPRGAVARMEGIVVTEGTPSPAELPVTVGAGKTGIDYQFLKPLTVFLTEISGKGIVSFRYICLVFTHIGNYGRKNNKHIPNDDPRHPAVGIDLSAGGRAGWWEDLWADL